MLNPLSNHVSYGKCWLWGRVSFFVFIAYRNLQGKPIPPPDQIIPRHLRPLDQIILRDPGAVSRVGRKSAMKVLSMGGKTLGYWLSSDHFITVKQMLAPDWPQKMLCIIVPNRANSISWVLILDSQIKSSLDIHAPRIRSSRYSWPLDQIIEIFATPRSNHPQIFVPPD